MEDRLQVYIFFLKKASTGTRFNPARIGTIFRDKLELCFEISSNYASTMHRTMLRDKLELCFDGASNSWPA